MVVARDLTSKNGGVYNCTTYHNGKNPDTRWGNWALSRGQSFSRIARSELMGLQLETFETSSPDNMFVRRTCLTKSNHIWVTMPPNFKFDSFEIRIYSGICQKWSKWRYQWTLTTDQSIFLGFIILAHPCEKCAKKFMRFAGLAWILAIELVAISFSCFQSSQAMQQLKTCLDSSRSPIVYVYMILYNIQWYISIIK